MRSTNNSPTSQASFFPDRLTPNCRLQIHHYQLCNTGPTNHVRCYQARRFPACLPQPTHPKPTQYLPSQPQPNHYQPRPPQSNSVLSKPEAIHRPLHCAISKDLLHSALNYKAKSNYTRSSSLLDTLQNYHKTAPNKVGTGPGPTNGTASLIYSSVLGSLAMAAGALALPAPPSLFV
ncbi:hypothetical protein HNY73_007901 [Argiope bruennichi]|uniref:Uncharacterized protein n=1 Tax=Argiope bruennichi TaxID=94029 RepID=A0A8T0F5L8_ARGBR|nr:hypothetical protein HNY73_007901 [Argiope bruennichi]